MMIEGPLKYLKEPLCTLVQQSQVLKRTTNSYAIISVFQMEIGHGLISKYRIPIIQKFNNRTGI
jgi:hypothetical protein